MSDNIPNEAKTGLAKILYTIAIDWKDDIVPDSRGIYMSDLLIASNHTRSISEQKALNLELTDEEKQSAPIFHQPTFGIPTPYNPETYQFYVKNLPLKDQVSKDELETTVRKVLKEYTNEMGVNPMGLFIDSNTDFINHYQTKSGLIIPVSYAKTIQEISPSLSKQIQESLDFKPYMPTHPVRLWLQTA